MHILIIHQAFASLEEPGGTRHAEFARYLARHGHDVTIIASPVSYLTGSASVPSSNSGEAPPVPPGVRILRARVYSALHRSWIHRTLAFFSFMFSSFWLGLGVRGVDLVWGTSPPIFQGFTAWLLAAIKRVPFVFEVRDLWPEFAIAVGVLKHPTLIAASEWLERFLYHRAGCVIVNSPGFIGHVKSRGARQVELVPNSADPAMFDPNADGTTFRSTNGLGGRFVALYAGAHGMSNDLGVLLAAAALLQDMDVCIVLLGDGKEKPSLMAHAAALHLKNVVFVPAVPKRLVPAALAAADACIAILKPLEAYKTTYPNKVFDYMAAGRPVILAIDGVIREVVEDAACGIFVRPGDGAGLARVIRELAQDRDGAREMGARGREYVGRHFNRDVIAQGLTTVLENLVAGGANDRSH